MATVPDVRINMATEYTQKSIAGAVASYETTATWSMGEGQPKGSAKGLFDGPTYPSADAIVAYLKTLDVAGVTEFFDSWFYGRSLKRKAKLRPVSSEDSPWITRDGIRINLFTGERINVKTNAKLPDLSMEKRIAGINAGFADADTYGNEVKGNFVVARKMHLDAKTGAEANGKLVVAKK